MSRSACGRRPTQPGEALGCVRHGASDARVQSGRSWYATPSEQYAPAQTVAALLGLLGNRSQDTRRPHACLSALRACHATRPEQRVGGAHRCARHTKHAWNGRGGETQTSAPATGQVRDPRNPRYSRASGLAAGEFIGSQLKLRDPRRIRPATAGLRREAPLPQLGSALPSGTDAAVRTRLCWNGSAPS